jgi:hypothetical protein
MTHDEMIAVIQAHKDGKLIECRGKEFISWSPAHNPAWDFRGYDYRIKPEPRRIWVNYYGNDDYGNACLSRENADRECRVIASRLDCIEFVEVFKEA